jgi:hypothetical protein
MSQLQGFRVELAQPRAGNVRLFEVSTRLFFASIWVAGTVAATSLGWTAVALVAQRVGDRPIEQSLALLPTQSSSSTDIGNSAEPAESFTSADTGIASADQPAPADNSLAAAANDQAGLDASSSSTDLVFDPAFNAEAPALIPSQSNNPLATKQPQPTATASAASAASAGQRVLAASAGQPTSPAGLIAPVEPVRAKGDAPIAHVEPSQNEQPKAPANATIAVSKLTPLPKTSAALTSKLPVAAAVANPAQVTPKEIHPNPGKAFGTAPTTLPVQQTVSAKSAKPTEPKPTATQKPRASSASTRAPKRPPIPLAPAATPQNPVPAEQLLTPTEQNPSTVIPSVAPVVITPPAPVPVEPPVLIITAAPTPVAPTAVSPVSVTIPASAIVITTSPPTPIQPTPVTPTPATPTPTPAPTPTIASTTKPAPVVQAYQLSNGSVGVHCVGNQIVLDFATPSPGASLRVDSSGPEEVKLRFTSSGGSDRSDSQFVAFCRRGVPTRDD